MKTIVKLGFLVSLIGFGVINAGGEQFNIDEFGGEGNGESYLSLHTTSETKPVVQRTLSKAPEVPTEKYSALEKLVAAEDKEAKASETIQKQSLINKVANFLTSKKTLGLGAALGIAAAGYYWYTHKA